ncbi:hypothetical protein [Bathymodiolus septemdierum thioautotrophic gill symbiont]|uniref:hypothetical protein n=1 Tax=Bathymodiolus septemdierum thioautotrophic gill symbiont TaxID=113267 RepID=UPI0012ECDE4D|nr:hypothetical protein [Bathymodiolus septemdierum thioautotrophic gill symbiont]
MNMKYIVLLIVIALFAGSYITLSSMYKGGQGKGAESVKVTVMKIQSSKNRS